MRTILACFVFGCCLAGAAGLSLASVPTQTVSPSASIDAKSSPVARGGTAADNTPDSAAVSPAYAATQAGAGVQPESAEKLCASLEQTYDQARDGDAQAQYRLALWYEGGLCGLCKDDPLAGLWFRKSAEAGKAEAQFEMGLRCFFGHGAQRSLEQAVSWMQKAAQQGHAEAQYRLAGFLEDGLGVTVDKDAAISWYKKSAELGFPQAQNALGIYCANGLGMPRDAHAAALWFQRAALQGYATAQYNIARSYEMGDGIAQDKEKARYWYGKAARQGDADAQARLAAF